MIHLILIPELTSDLGTGSDIFVVSSGATLNPTPITSFTATLASRNDGTANLTAATGGGVIDLSNVASGAGSYTITVGAGTDTVTGSSGNDVFVVAGTTQGNADTINGGGGTDGAVIWEATLFY